MITDITAYRIDGEYYFHYGTPNANTKKKSKRQSIAIALSMVGKKRKKPSLPKRGQRTRTNNRKK